MNPYRAIEFVATPPNPETRDRGADLKIVCKQVVKDRLGFLDDHLNPHIVETPDLLIAYVENALGISLRVNWSAVKDEELPAIKAWQDYCAGLFDQVESFAIAAIDERTWK